MIKTCWMRAGIVLLLVGLYPDITRAAHIEPLYTPLPLDVGRGFTLSEVREAVSDSLINTGWRKQRSQENEIRAYRSKGRHKGQIGISWTSRLITFRYLGSEGLNATDVDGVEYIHGLYNIWVHDLENALKFRVNQLASEHERYGGRAPVSEVRIHPRRRRTAIIKHGPLPEVQEIKPEVAATPVQPLDQPATEQGAPPPGAVVQDVTVRPQTRKSRVRVSKQPAQHAPRQDVEIKTVETPASSNAASSERPPVDAKPAKPAQSRDLGELKW